MGPESRKKKQLTQASPVQPAEKEKPSQEAEAAAVDESKAEVEASVGSVPSVPGASPEESISAPALFDLSQFSEDKIQTAESLGIPITQIAQTMNSWAASVEARFQILAQELGSTPEKTIELLKKAAREAQQQSQIQQGQGPPQMQGGGGGEMGQVMGVLQALGMGGGGTDPYMQMFVGEVFKNGLESMSYGNAFVKAILSKVAPDVAAEVSKDITSKLAKFEGVKA